MNVQINTTLITIQHFLVGILKFLYWLSFILILHRKKRPISLKRIHIVIEYGFSQSKQINSFKEFGVQKQTSVSIWEIPPYLTKRENAS